MRYVAIKPGRKCKEMVDECKYYGRCKYMYSKKVYKCMIPTWLKTKIFSNNGKGCVKVITEEEYLEE